MWKQAAALRIYLRKHSLKISLIFSLCVLLGALAVDFALTQQPNAPGSTWTEHYLFITRRTLWLAALVITLPLIGAELIERACDTTTARRKAFAGAILLALGAVALVESLLLPSHDANRKLLAAEGLQYIIRVSREENTEDRKKLAYELAMKLMRIDAQDHDTPENH